MNQFEISTRIAILTRTRSALLGIGKSNMARENRSGASHGRR